MKAFRGVQTTEERHWVGDGFPVRTLFSYPNLGRELSPFLLFDYAGPEEFPATTARRGVGPHPHRGFETVTIVYSGEVEHRDSAGGGGKIGPGDVQWMTAGSGLVHEEFHGRDYATRGGLFEMVQLWVNLPAADKAAAPRYQSIFHTQIPAVNLAGNAGTARIIAGKLDGNRGPAETFTPMDVWDMRLASNTKVELPVPDGQTTSLVVLRGGVRLDGDSGTISAAEVGLFERDGDSIAFETTEETTALLLGGQPIDEPIAGHGPFVMNTREEIEQAMSDFASGKMGKLS